MDGAESIVDGSTARLSAAHGLSRYSLDLSAAVDCRCHRQSKDRQRRPVSLVPRVIRFCVFPSDRRGRL